MQLESFFVALPLTEDDFDDNDNANDDNNDNDSSLSFFPPFILFVPSFLYYYEVLVDLIHGILHYGQFKKYALQNHTVLFHVKKDP